MNINKIHLSYNRINYNSDFEGREIIAMHLNLLECVCNALYYSQTIDKQDSIIHNSNQNPFITLVKTKFISNNLNNSN